MNRLLPLVKSSISKIVPFGLSSLGSHAGDAYDILDSSVILYVSHGFWKYVFIRSWGTHFVSLMDPSSLSSFILYSLIGNPVSRNVIF